MTETGARAGIGHNQGPSMERGHRWRSYQWRQVQKAAMPKAIPLNVVRMRVRRARELGLSYAAYAAIRQATGRDILALLFSSNALRVVRAGAPQIPVTEAEVLASVARAQKLALVQRPLQPGQVATANPVLDACASAPVITDSWSAMRGKVEGLVQARRLVGDQVLIIGDTGLEREWRTAARAAGYLEARAYFGG